MHSREEEKTERDIIHIFILFINFQNLHNIKVKDNRTDNFLFIFSALKNKSINRSSYQFISEVKERYNFRCFFIYKVQRERVSPFLCLCFLKLCVYIPSAQSIIETTTSFIQ